MNIIFAIIIFSIIILFHELGHFLLAKKNDVQVNEFCLGLGPTIIGKKIGETKYSLKLFPFGGACMMEGEDEASDSDRSFRKKGVWQRFSIVFAGPFFNFIMAWFFALIILCAVGVDEPIVNSVIENSPAAEIGIADGDRIVKLGKKNIHFYRDVTAYMFFHDGEAVDVTWEHDGERYTKELVPEFDEEVGRYLIGIRGVASRQKTGFFRSVQYSFYEVSYWITTTLKSLGKLVTGQLKMNDLSGPVGIVKTIGDAYTASKPSGGFYVFLNLLNMAVLLSANLGVMNLLPLPALDGGRLVFFIIEAIRGKRIDPDKEGMVHFIGLVLLMLFMVVIMFNDIRKLFM
ncbi:MAG: RIP metalloprotease RseP [bacterium]|nr:RIP metalloprotease RseP [bacterium]